MLGLLGNVAEVKGLRPQLMTSQFISVFRLVLPGPPENSEQSGVLWAHCALSRLLLLYSFSL